MTALAPIPTRYAGCHFRSRLEARWAVFFDALDMSWQYEPEGFDLSEGPYLPDFYLPSIDVWLEVKGRDGDRSKWTAFHKAVNESNEWFVRMTPSPLDVRPDERLPDSLRTVWSPDRTHRPFVGKVPSRTFLIGSVPDPRDLPNCYGVMLGPGSPHSGWTWVRCHNCGEFDIAHVSMESFMYCGAQGGEWGWDDAGPRLLNAYRAARSARFEHGESGAT